MIQLGGPSQGRVPRLGSTPGGCSEVKLAKYLHNIPSGEKYFRGCRVQSGPYTNKSTLMAILRRFMKIMSKDTEAILFSIRIINQFDNKEQIRRGPH